MEVDTLGLAEINEATVLVHHPVPIGARGVTQNHHAVQRRHPVTPCRGGGFPDGVQVVGEEPCVAHPRGGPPIHRSALRSPLGHGLPCPLGQDFGPAFGARLEGLSLQHVTFELVGPDHHHHHVWMYLGHQARVVGKDVLLPVPVGNREAEPEGAATLDLDVRSRF